MPSHASTGGTGAVGGQGTLPSMAGSLSITVPVPHCGDQAADPDEECDDGNRFDGDGCSSLCRVEPGSHCPPTGPCNRGDGRLSADEACDDGNTAAGDGCTSDGMLEDGWVCPLPGKPCRVRCGDGKTTPPETCDDGNIVNGDGCARNCRREPLCGATGGEHASAGAGGESSAGASGESSAGAAGASGESGAGAAGTSGATSACADAVCGDGIVGSDEQCDDGALNLGLYGGCLSTCVYATYCGDGVVDAGAGEACDDGHNVAGYGESGCAPGCRLPHFCGDGRVDADHGEMCDPGMTRSSSCGRNCTLII